jgi:hypothetical protein
MFDQRRMPDNIYINVAQQRVLRTLQRNRPA